MATTSTNRTPLFLMASHPTMNTVYEETKSPTSKTRGRKPSKGPTQKKQAQRGLGVEKLERLRIQESWKKMTEFPSSLPDPQPPLQCQTPFMSPFTEHHVSGSVPVQYRAPAPPSSVVNGSCGAGNGGAGFGGTFGMLMSDQVVLNPYAGIGVPDPRVFVETSRELSSMPKLQSVPHNCDLCLKKKRFNGGNIGFDGGRDQNSETSPISGSAFHGSNLENIPNFTSNFGATTAPRHATRNLDQGVEVVAIHRKGNSMCGSVFMEYEFFPGKSGRGTSSKGLELPGEGSVAVGGEPSYPTTTAYCATSSSVDLSLKLSY
ncbi:uncharacterized protein LOC126693920 isoform X2 [Quercus robur]|uniref:uncharacterized protein LOC126693920 isoform X2 n=1 Tax=Quercus robur TaxID=38942 RepID=UPI0021618EEB|nr:uncharacterized protein LOC126693920 isoform X2 [Quercus robur]